MNAPKALARAFFQQNTVEVAQQLLGQYIVRRDNQTILLARVVETEAYLGIGDAAAHVVAGKTKRTQILFGQAGMSYVFQTRQHCCFNVSTELESMPSSVLFRAVEPIAGITTMLKNRGIPELQSKLCNGPAKLCAALGIGMQHYGLDLTDSESELYLATLDQNPVPVMVSQRIGINKAKDLMLRFTTLSQYLSR
jgi:DNA-3-methyladenine glycosylase